MNVVRHRPSARFEIIAPAGFRILAALDHAATACRTDLMITSGTDSHDGGAHPLGEAYDVSVHLLSAQQIWDLYTNLRGTLGSLFTVLFETNKTPSDPTLRPIASINPEATGPHLHVQRRKHTTFPPEDVTPPTPRIA